MHDEEHLLHGTKHNFWKLHLSLIKIIEEKQ